MPETSLLTGPLARALTAASPAPLLMDGAMGTMLQVAGLDDGGAPELWNVDRPQVISTIHGAYLAVGARVITTDTFGRTRPRPARHGLGGRVGGLSRAGAELARACVEPYGALVAGGLGPTGELLEPLARWPPTRPPSCSPSRSRRWPTAGRT